jgi:hypothetical protein
MKNRGIELLSTAFHGGETCPIGLPATASHEIGIGYGSRAAARSSTQTGKSRATKNLSPHGQPPCGGHANLVCFLQRPPLAKLVVSFRVESLPGKLNCFPRQGIFRVVHDTTDFWRGRGNQLAGLARV